MGFVRWYMSLFEKKEKPTPKKVVVEDTATVSNTDVRFGHNKRYDLELDDGYSLTISKDATIGRVTLFVRGEGTDDYNLSVVLSRYAYKKYSNVRYIGASWGTQADVPAADPVPALNQLRDRMVAYLMEKHKETESWRSI